MPGPHAGGVSGGVMQVLYPRCCALDVHKATVVACLRLIIDGKVIKEVRTFETTTASLMALSDWLGRQQVYTYRHGSDRCLLEAGVAHLGGRRFRIGVGQ